jgi:hypothetical protein
MGLSDSSAVAASAAVPKIGIDCVAAVLGRGLDDNADQGTAGVTGTMAAGVTSVVGMDSFDETVGNMASEAVMRKVDTKTSFCHMMNRVRRWMSL